MKGLLITIGAVAAVAGIAYLLRDNETVKGAIDKINDTANDTLSKISDQWKKTSDQFNGKVASQA